MPPEAEQPGTAASTGPLVGRAELLAAVEARTAAQGSVLLTGPRGIGKSALLHAAGAAARTRGELVLHTVAVSHEQRTPFAALAGLLAQVPAADLDALPEPQHGALAALLPRLDPGLAEAGPDAGTGAAVVRLAWLTLLGASVTGRRVLVVVDDAQWLDAPSAEALRYAARRLAGRGLRVLAAGARDDLAPRPWSLSPTAVEMPVPPLAGEELAELLELHGLPARVATTLHADSGGNPQLALTLGRSFAGRLPRHGRPAPLTAPVRADVVDRLAALPGGARQTLLTAALAARPTVGLLLRAGCADAEAEVRLAATAGLLVRDAYGLRFTPPAVADVLAEYAGAGRRAEVHTVLARVVPDAAGRLRHRALAAGGPDPATARELACAAREAAGRGGWAQAAELYLLAADHAPCTAGSDRVGWLVRAAEAGAHACRPQAVHRAADAVLAGDATAAQRVRVRLALLDLAGRGLEGMDDVLAAARLDAGADPALRGPLGLRLAWAALVAGDPAQAEWEADRAVSCARSASDTATEAMGLAAKATAARLRGRVDHDIHLHRALRLPEPAAAGRPHLTPRYTAAWFALVDDRLSQAREELLELLVPVEHGGGAAAVHVLCALSEVSVRGGRCREALDFADRAVRLSREAGLSPGPAWHAAAAAELAGGSVARAVLLAERGLRASEQEGDGVCLARHLHVLGRARLRQGDVRGGVSVLLRLRELEQRQGVHAPAVRRWHGDLASGLAALGDVEQARGVLRAARTELGGPGRGGAVTGLLDRALAAVRLAEGDPEGARELLRGALGRFEDVGALPEAGHTLLELARLERRCRRHGAAREWARQALELFTRCGALPWIAVAERSCGAVEAPAASAAQAADLTATEERIAMLVGEGATNQEVAARMFVSVKTVEASLTRVYRKLGLRSRTQLGSWLHSASRPAAG